MTKTKEELNQLKQEYESLKMKLKELTEDELKQVTGGIMVETEMPLTGSTYRKDIGSDKNAKVIF